MLLSGYWGALFYLSFLLTFLSMIKSFSLLGFSIFLSFFTACKEHEVLNPADKTNLPPYSLVVSTQLVGVSATKPNGDGSGTVNFSVSARNATSYQIFLPSESKTLYISSAAGGTVSYNFQSNPGQVSSYTFQVSAFNGSLRKDSIFTIEVFYQLQLVWSDEFNGSTLNTSTWNYETGNNNGWGNNELEYYTSDSNNIKTENGYLEITAKYSPNYNSTGFNYTSARINTQNKFTFQYGKVDILAKLPGDSGTWPALWLLGSNIGVVGWPACGEIDMMEMGTVTGLNNILCSLHWGSDTSQQKNIPGSTTDFHLYSMDWRADHISFYIDNVLLYTFPNTSAKPFNQNFFFIFNVAVGGNMGSNNVNLSTSSTMYIDYIRVYN